MKLDFRRYSSRINRLSIPIILLFSLALPSAVHAADGPGTAGALYLRLPVSPKSISMGEAGVAINGDNFGWLSNPGLMEGTDGTGFGIFHSQWVMDSYYDNAFVSHRFHRTMSVAAGLTYLSTPEVQGFDATGSPTEMLKNNSFQGILGLCFNPIDNFGAGANIKYFQEKIADFSASGVAFDIGAVFRLPFPSISIGASAQNIGPGIKFITESEEEELPLTLRGGVAYDHTVVPAILALTFAVDAVKPRHLSTYPVIGAELRVREIIGVRVGYCGEKDREHNGFTAGGGIDIMGKLTVDYAWTPYGDLGNFHRVSIFFKR